MAETRHPPRTEPHIRPLTASGAALVGAGMAKIDPWARLGFTKERLLASMTGADGVVAGFEAVVDGAPAALITYVPAWLYGPYIRLLVVLPHAQGRGFGRALVERVADVARGQGQANLWVCASAFNQSALTFYDRLEFRQIGVLDDLVAVGEDEVLLRRRL